MSMIVMIFWFDRTRLDGFAARGGPGRPETARGLPETKTARFDTESQLKTWMKNRPSETRKSGSSDRPGSASILKSDFDEIDDDHDDHEHDHDDLNAV